MTVNVFCVGRCVLVCVVSEANERLRKQIADMELTARRAKQTVNIQSILDDVQSGSYHAVYAARKYVQKIDLLDGAISRVTSDGSDPQIVLCILLFLRETLAPALFLESVKAAADGAGGQWPLQLLLAHLERTEGSESLLFDLYRALNRPRDAAMHKLRLAYKERNVSPSHSGFRPWTDRQWGRWCGGGDYVLRGSRMTDWLH